MTNSSSIRIMTAFRDLATHLAAAADSKLSPTYPFLPAFLDDDSDYMPAALDMMHELMRALTDDNPDDASRDLLDRITRDDFMLTEPTLRYSDLPLDAPCDLPFLDPYAD